MERMEAIGNGGLGGDKRSRDWAKLEGFLRQSQRINEMKLMKSMGWRKQAHKCWLYCFSSSLLMCFSNYTPPPEIQFQPTPSLTLHLVFLPSQSLAQFSRSHPSSTPLPLVLTPLILVPLSAPPHLLSLSSSSPPLLPAPTHSWYSTALSGQLYDRSSEKGGSTDTESNTLRAAVQAAHCCSTPVRRFHRVCEAKW